MPDELEDTPDLGRPKGIAKNSKTLEERQLEMAGRVRRNSRGNPYLQKGVRPYNTDQTSFEQWLEDHPGHMLKPASHSEIIRQFLKAWPNGRSSKIKGPRLVMLLHAVYKAATTPGKNQIFAAQLLMNRAFGKERASEEDLNAIKKGGLTLIYVDRRENDPDIPMAPQKALEAAPPEFLDEAFPEESDGK